MERCMLAPNLRAESLNGVTITRRCLLRAASTCGALALARPSRAQTVRKLTRMIVGYPPGGSTDVIARLVVDQMKGYAQTIIVENRPGTGGRLALETLKLAPPDGSVMILTPATTIAIYPHISKSIGYDALADFIPVVPVASFSSVLSVGPMVPVEVKTLSDFIAWCRANPARATYGTTGAGSVLHFAGMMLGKAANIEFTYVPYKGAGPVLQDLLGGQIASAVNVISSALPHIRAGALRPLAMATAQRSPFLTDVPTFAELGYPGIALSEWQGIFVPARTPEAIVEALNRSVREALQTNAVRSGLVSQSFEVGGQSTQEFAARVKADYARWGAIARETGFTAEE
jgi:tripartite-type tricarboxylate transporter receptor subunit TctC